jgi:Na+/H+ antiporter NhaC
MDFLYGLLTAVVFFIALISFYFIGYKQGNKHTSKPPDDEEVRKAKVMRVDFMNMMNYDVDTALKRKKVQ